MKCWLQTVGFILSFPAIFVGMIASIYGLILGIGELVRQINKRFSIPTSVETVASHFFVTLIVLTLVVGCAAGVMKSHQNICAKGFAAYWSETWK